MARPQPTSLEDKIQQLKEQNGEMAKSAQFWRMQYKKLEDEKINLIRENNELNLKHKHYFHKMEQFNKLLQDTVCRSMKDWLQFGTYVENMRELIDEHNGACSKSCNDNSSANLSSLSSPSNVHHVRPMIQGITLKTPILSLSRANLNNSPTNRNDDSFRNEVTITNSPQRNNVSLQAQNLNLRRLTVSLSQIDENSLSTYLRRDNSMQNVSNDDNERARPHQEYAPCELSVSLTEIDPYKRRVSRGKSKNESQQHNEEESAKRNLFSNVHNDGMENKENSYSSDEDHSEEYQGSDCLKYSSRLECIIEESENDDINVSLRTKSIIPTCDKTNDENESEQVFDDPLEGPSWRFENSKSPEVTKSPFNFITSRKKIFHPVVVLEHSPIIKEKQQMPDSTTDIKSPSMGTSSSENTISPQFQSTPNVAPTKVQVQAVGNDDELFTTLSEKSMSVSKIVSFDESVDDKSKNRKRNSGNKSKVKRPGKVHKVDKNRKSLEKKANMQCTLSVSRLSSIGGNSSRDSSSSTAGLDSARPKRGARKDYKEKSAKKKLRRS